MIDMMKEDIAKVWSGFVLFHIKEGRVRKSLLSVGHSLCELEIAKRTNNSSPELVYVLEDSTVPGGHIRIFSSKMDCVSANVSTNADGNITSIYVEGYSLSSYKTILKNIVKCLRNMPSINVPESDLKTIMGYEFSE